MRVSRLLALHMSLCLTDVGLQNLALGLVLALQTLPASRLVHSASSGKNLFGDLLRFPTIIGSDDFDSKQIIPPLQIVLNNERDELV